MLRHLRSAYQLPYYFFNKIFVSCIAYRSVFRLNCCGRFIIEIQRRIIAVLAVITRAVGYYHCRRGQNHNRRRNHYKLSVLHTAPPACTLTLYGRRIINTLPISEAPVTSIVPLCISTASLVIARPRPVPPVSRARESSRR